MPEGTLYFGRYGKVSHVSCTEESQEEMNNHVEFHATGSLHRFN